MTSNTGSIMNDNDDMMKTGAQLFSEWGCETRDQKLERACAALMDRLNDLHKIYKRQDLHAALNDEGCCCSCADAYRMGAEVLKDTPLGRQLEIG